MALIDGKQIAPGTVTAAQLADDAKTTQTPLSLLDIVEAASPLESLAASELLLYRLMGGS